MIDLNDPSSKEVNEDELMEKDEKLRDTYLFRPKRLPPSRQVFYQYKNILVPEAQEIIDSYKSNDPHCDEKVGWFKKGLEDNLRDILAETIKTTCIDDDDLSSMATENIATNLDELEENDFSDSSGDSE